MPDYNRRAAVYWWCVVPAGWLLLAWCVARVLALPALTIVQIAAGMLAAIGAGLFPVRIPGTRVSFAAGEICIFLVLLLFGPAAAALTAAAEGATASLRTSRRWTSRLATPAIAAIAIFVVGTAFEAARAALAARGLDGAVPLLGAAIVMALTYFPLSAMLLGGVMRLKRGEAYFQLGDAVSVFRWVGLAYAGSAAVSTLLVLVYRQAGPGVLMVMLPVLALLLVTLHFYFRQQEAAEAMLAVNAEAATREAALAAGAAEAAERHLRELEASERRFHSAFTHASIGMALLDFDGRIVQTNAALRDLLGRDEPALAGASVAALVHEADRAAFAARLGLAGGREFEAFALEMRLVGAGGDERWVSAHCSFFTERGEGGAPGESGERPGLILQAQDIGARRRAEAGLQHLAYHDSLTGLPNRRRFMECLTGSIARVQGGGGPAHSFAVLFLDFDRFKLVNDSLGHGAGDELLVQLARRIQERLRPSDIVARLGGDEFAILAEHIEHQRDAIVLAERLLAALARPFDLLGHEISASASIGITFSHFGYRSAEEVLRDADTAMYKAKAGGKARFAVFDASLHTDVSRRLRLEGELRRAIEAGHLAVVYQPVYELAAQGAGRLVGFEALVRWRHPAEGELAPMSFLPIAEESGLMRPLSDFVLHCACRQLRQWQLSDPAWSELTMSVNVSADDMVQSGFVARVTQAVLEAGLRPQHLTLELTENILMSRVDGAVATLAELRRLGVNVAVDDFGTGYSSLSHLSKLPIDSLKIDRSFVGHLAPGSDEAAVVRAIIQLGHSLRKAIVAEGIETAAQAEQLRAMGCAFGQGHHLSHPLSAADAGELLRVRAGGVALH
jgi:diguanylate cyclase (GGDEF)-like protein/PAS domain S-box-containing protein